jgi:hypothetical protein
MGQGKSFLVEKLTEESRLSSASAQSFTLSDVTYMTNCGRLGVTDTPGANAMKGQLQSNTCIAQALNGGPVDLILLVVKADTRITTTRDNILKYLDKFGNLADEFDILGVAITHMDQVAWEPGEMLPVIKEELEIARAVFSGQATDGAQLVGDILDVCVPKPVDLTIDHSNFKTLFPKVANSNFKTLKAIRDAVNKFSHMETRFQEFLVQAELDPVVVGMRVQDEQGVNGYVAEVIKDADGIKFQVNPEFGEGGWEANLETLRLQLKAFYPDELIQTKLQVYETQRHTDLMFEFQQFMTDEIPRVQKKVTETCGFDFTGPDSVTALGYIASLTNQLGSVLYRVRAETCARQAESGKVQEFRKFRKCPHCDSIWAKVNHCKGETTCGYREHEMDPRFNEMAHFKFHFDDDGSLKVTPAEARMEELKGDIDGFGIGVGCGKRIQWSLMAPVQVPQEFTAPKPERAVCRWEQSWAECCSESVVSIVNHAKSFVGGDGSDSTEAHHGTREGSHAKSAVVRTTRTSSTHAGVPGSTLQTTGSSIVAARRSCSVTKTAKTTVHDSCPARANTTVSAKRSRSSSCRQWDDR